MRNGHSTHLCPSRLACFAVVVVRLRWQQHRGACPTFMSPGAHQVQPTTGARTLPVLGSTARRYMLRIMVRIMRRALLALYAWPILVAASSWVMFLARLTRRRRFLAVNRSSPSTHGFVHMVPGSSSKGATQYVRRGRNSSTRRSEAYVWYACRSSTCRLWWGRLHGGSWHGQFASSSAAPRTSARHPVPRHSL